MFGSFIKRALKWGVVFLLLPAKIPPTSGSSDLDPHEAVAYRHLKTGFLENECSQKIPGILLKPSIGQQFKKLISKCTLGNVATAKLAWNYKV